MHFGRERFLGRHLTHTLSSKRESELCFITTENPFPLLYGPLSTYLAPPNQAARMDKVFRATERSWKPSIEFPYGWYSLKQHTQIPVGTFDVCVVEYGSFEFIWTAPTGLYIPSSWIRQFWAHSNNHRWIFTSESHFGKKLTNNFG